MHDLCFTNLHACAEVQQRLKHCHVLTVEMTALQMNVNHCGFIHKLCQSLYFAHFSFIKDVCICTFLISKPFNMRHDEWKKKSFAFCVYLLCWLYLSVTMTVFSFLLPPLTFLLSHHVSCCVLLAILSFPLHAFLLLSYTCFMSANLSSLYHSHLSIFQPLYLSQYFDEEQDDHE